MVHPQPPMTPAQAQAQRQAQQLENDMAKRRSQKPTDKNIPEGVEGCIIGDGVQRYRDLRDVERRLDAAMMRKRLDVQDAVNRTVKVSYAKCWIGCLHLRLIYFSQRYRTLRIWISN